MRPLGILLIAISFLVPAVLFVSLADGRDAAALFSQYLGACALIAMAYCQVFATRITGVELVFGGLDRVYVLHKWLAIAAMAMIVLHDTIDADMDGLGRQGIVTEIAETLGEISLYGLLVLTTLSVATFVPYHLWKYTHKLMGAFFAAAALHYAFILRPFSLSDPLGLYILVFCVIGVAAYAYTLLPVGALTGWRNYMVTNVERTGNATSVTLSPVGRGFRHHAGQFAFLSFDQPDFGETHPFTISQAPKDDRSLRFTIKDLGDFTAALPGTISAGSGARVAGPFGHFRLRQRRGEQIWIASGVGITPFIAWAQALGEQAGPVHLFYSFRTEDDAPHLAELRAIAETKANLNLHLIETGRIGRLTIDQIKGVAAAPAAQIHVGFCGPKDMRQTLQKQLTNAGFDARKFHYEEFEIRTGLGLRQLADRLWKPQPAGH